MFKRPVFQKILPRLRDPRKFIQVLAGPRQVGKTILAQQLAEELKHPVFYVSAGECRDAFGLTLDQKTYCNCDW